MDPATSLRAAGLRRTPARIVVLTRITALARPLTHAELLAEPELQDLDDITLYRTLGALVDAEYFATTNATGERRPA